MLDERLDEALPLRHRRCLPERRQMTHELRYLLNPHGGSRRRPGQRVVDLREALLVLAVVEPPVGIGTCEPATTIKQTVEVVAARGGGTAQEVLLPALRQLDARHQLPYRLVDAPSGDSATVRLARAGVPLAVQDVTARVRLAVQRVPTPGAQDATAQHSLGLGAQAHAATRHMAATR